MGKLKSGFRKVFAVKPPRQSLDIDSNSVRDAK